MKGGNNKMFNKKARNEKRFGLFYKKHYASQLVQVTKLVTNSFETLWLR